MLSDMKSGIDEQSGDLLGFAEHVGENDGNLPGADGRVKDARELIEGLSTGRHPVFWQAKGGFHHQVVGARRVGRFGGRGGSESKIARIEQLEVGGFDEQHGRSEDMAGGESGQSVIVPSERFAKGQFVDQPVAAEPAAVEPSGCGRAEREFMGREVIEMSMGDEAAGLPLAGIDSQVEIKEPQSVIEEKQGKVRRMLPVGCQRDRMSRWNFARVR
jgi:hypothetical protein